MEFAQSERKQLLSTAHLVWRALTLVLNELEHAINHLNRFYEKLVKSQKETTY